MENAFCIKMHQMTRVELLLLVVLLCTASSPFRVWSIRKLLLLLQWQVMKKSTIHKASAAARVWTDAKIIISS